MLLAAREERFSVTQIRFLFLLLGVCFFSFQFSFNCQCHCILPLHCSSVPNSVYSVVSACAEVPSRRLCSTSW